MASEYARRKRTVSRDGSTEKASVSIATPGRANNTSSKKKPLCDVRCIAADGIAEGFSGGGVVDDAGGMDAGS